MDCKRASNLMMKYFDREINDIEDKELNLHLKECSTCRLDFQWMKAAFLDIEELEEFETPDNFEMEILEQVDLQRYKSKRSSGREKTWGAVAVSSIVTIWGMMIYLRYGTIDWKEGYTGIISFMKFVDLGNRMYAFLGVTGKALGKILFTLVKGLSQMSVFLDSQMGMYLTIVAFLCTVFISTQYVLMRLTGSYAYRGGRTYEE